MEILLELTKFYDVNMHLDNIITLARYLTHNSNLQRFRCHLYINYLIPERKPHFGSMIPTNPQQSQLKTFNRCRRHRHVQQKYARQLDIVQNLQ